LNKSILFAVEYEANKVNSIEHPKMLSGTPAEFYGIDLSGNTGHDSSL